MDVYYWKFTVVVLLISVNSCFTQESYCKLCSNHVACRPPKGFGPACGKIHSAVPMTTQIKQLWLQLHNGMRSIVAAGKLQSFPAATQMSLVQWNDELAELALINARECSAHYDQCRITANFPKVGQNTHIDREESSKLNITQSIYRTAFKWFNEYEKTDGAGIQRYHIPRSIRLRYNRFAVMVQDRLQYVGCAAVQFYDQQEDYQKVSWVCNYSMANTQGVAVYEGGMSGTKCAAGKDWGFPNLCKPSLMQTMQSMQPPHTVRAN